MELRGVIEIEVFGAWVTALEMSPFLSPRATVLEAAFQYTRGDQFEATLDDSLTALRESDFEGRVRMRAISLDELLRAIASTTASQDEEPLLPVLEEVLRLLRDRIGAQRARALLLVYDE